MKSTGSRAKQGKASLPPRLRCKLRSIDDVRLELGRIYRDAKTNRRPVGDATKLAFILQILARLIEGSDIEARLAKLEESDSHDN